MYLYVSHVHILTGAHVCWCTCMSVHVCSSSCEGQDLRLNAFFVVVVVHAVLFTKLLTLPVPKPVFIRYNRYPTLLSPSPVSATGEQGLHIKAPHLLGVFVGSGNSISVLILTHKSYSIIKTFTHPETCRGLTRCMASQRKTCIFAMFMNIAMSHRNFLQWNKVKAKDFQCQNKLFLIRWRHK